jgi:hypothetical protein
MNFKPDNKCVDSEDITLVFEIIDNSRFWQEIYRRESVKIGANLEHIINFTEVKRILIYVV